MRNFIIKVLNIGFFGILAADVESDDVFSLIIVLGAAITLAAGYLIGSFSPSIYFSKKYFGGDIRESGSGNAGSTNMLRTHGKKAGIMTALGDLGKSVVACFIGYLILGYDGAALAGFAAVVGHIAPVFYRFKGGKGVMVAAGTLLCLDPIVFLVCIAIFAGIILLSKTVSIGSAMTALIYPLIFIRLGGHFGIPMVTAIITMVLVLFMHRHNISRILEGTEPKISIGGKKKSDKEEEAAEENAEEAGGDASTESENEKKESKMNPNTSKKKVKKRK